MRLLISIILYCFFTQVSAQSELQIPISISQFKSLDSLIIYNHYGSCTYDKINKYILYPQGDSLKLIWFGRPVRTEKSYKKIKYWKIWGKGSQSDYGWIEIEKLIKKQSKYATYLDHEEIMLPISYFEVIAEILYTAANGPDLEHRYDYNIYYIIKEGKTSIIEYLNHELSDELSLIFDEMLSR